MVWAIVLVTAASPSLSEEPEMHSSLGAQFADSISRVASIREVNRSTAIIVTDEFKDLMDGSGAAFREFLIARYRFIRVKTVVGNTEYADIDTKELWKFDRRFLPGDKLRVGFVFSSDWKNVQNARVSLLNDSTP